MITFSEISLTDVVSLLGLILATAVWKPSRDTFYWRIERIIRAIDLSEETKKEHTRYQENDAQLEDAIEYYAIWDPVGEKHPRWETPTEEGNGFHERRIGKFYLYCLLFFVAHNPHKYKRTIRKVTSQLKARSK